MSQLIFDSPVTFFSALRKSLASGWASRGDRCNVEPCLKRSTSSAALSTDWDKAVLWLWWRHTSSCRDPLTASHSSIDQPPDIGHRPKQLQGLVRKRKEAFPLVETASALIFRIDDHSERGDLAPRGAVERVGKQKAPVALTLLVAIDGKPAQQRRRDQWISRELAHSLCRQLGELYRCRREGAVSPDRPIRQQQDEGCGHVLPRVLASLRPEIAIERFYTALEFRT